VPGFLFCIKPHGKRKDIPHVSSLF
jgi:hypothetical protein